METGAQDTTRESRDPGRRRRRTRWILVSIGAAAAAGIAAAAVWMHVSAPTLQGAVVTPPAPVSDFTLLDQDRRPIRLSQFRGRAVALTFLYTHCPDVCPLIATRMHEAYLQLGNAAGRAAFIAVSVDPAGDTPGAVREFLAIHHLERELHYLSGSFAELRPVWANYYVGTDARGAAPRAAGGPAGAPVDHTAIVYVIDPRGRLRVFLPGNFESRDLALDLKILASDAAR
ncbi:MAG: SCO family protein [Bacillati bacterium ANGP1]|uniref:SCO family protein n=1 Tax=Candidatus Segetimicrobium genomatis TaxID=2569760 RepID=A0A537K2V6_9BACT|nr:MAG: SCO family protein [Terrabacteria group bacterium ANGP1]